MAQTQLLDCLLKPFEFQCIIAGDETWNHNYALDSKRQSLEWKHPTSLAKKSTKLNHQQEK
jgi:hypothetical protein